ncbi:Ig-like domain (group 4) [Gracilimonas mengyeensis]|uniref:Ig-like domain (Group 4) n=2 Tax=Gracilimonas mengyeensis TaxID=1302730 RepID=A0A521D848_9BACT|nr:Ig-like domain (group 4) [Gracilimonas mengyeensis]
MKRESLNLRMKISSLFLQFIGGLFLMALIAPPIMAQGGDQMLDGIGETALIVRYTLQEDLRDASRNNLHANIQGGYDFVSDSLFNSVLTISDEDETYITLPGEALEGLQSLSISGWILPQANHNVQPLFDFGTSPDSRFSAISSGTGSDDGFKTQIFTESDSYSLSAPSLELNQWNHLAMVIDVPAKTFSLYINGELADEVSGMRLELDDLFGRAKENKLYIGKSLSEEKAHLTARLYDFRIYSIPLSDEQVSTIRTNALRAGQEEAEQREETAQSLPEFPDSTPQLYTEYLMDIADIEVETVVGHLPRLPRFLKGTYRNDINGPEVRVIWPAPEDNSQVQSPGTYTVTGHVPGTDLRPQATITIKDKEAPSPPKRKLEPFSLSHVTLNRDSRGNRTKFMENRDKFVNGLAHTNPDRFLYMFRDAFGQEQPEGAEALNGWDSQETKLRGHASGHYLSAIAQAYASVGYDPSLKAEFADKMEYMVNTLYELSQLSGKPKNPGGEYVSDPTAVPPGPGKEKYNSDLSKEGIRTDYWNWGEGFISAYPPDQFIMLEHGATYGTDENQIWAPYYTLHKIFAGLMDIHEVTGNEKALEIVTGMGDWVHARLSKLPQDTLLSMWNRYIAGEFGGMNEAMARLYRLTGESKYLETARIFDNIQMFYGDADHSHGLARNVDTFRSLHANQHIPQVMGALEIYRDSDAPEYYRIADNFWHKVTGDYMYSIGGVAGARHPNNGECFVAQPATLYENGFSAGGQNETCATYNMLKLTRSLFFFNPDAELMDYYERGLYNHILASVAENSPANTYHVLLRPGSIKRFSNDDMSGFTCCNGTALESSTKLQNSIYFKSIDDQALYVNLFIPSTLEWTAKDITITQETAFPKADRTKLIIGGNGRFDLNIRIPKWASEGISVWINGEQQQVDAVPESYLRLSRSWEDGDTIELQLPFHFYLEPVMDQQNIASLFYGPVLLAAQESEAKNEWRKVTLDAEDISRSISGDPAQLEFTIDGIKYKPFYETYGRHSVYLDVNLE